MTRGRKKDQTVPPTRSLAHQRDYRERRAKYVTDLEGRCRAAEGENRRLRQELELVRSENLAGAASQLLDPRTAAASMMLLQHLSAAQGALVNFQQIVSMDDLQGLPSPPSAPRLRTVFPSPAPSPSGQYAESLDRQNTEHVSPIHQMLPSDPNDDRLSRSPSLGSECCGGWMDCSELVEPDEPIEVDGQQLTAITVSNVRSTRDHV